MKRITGIPLILFGAALAVFGFPGSVRAADDAMVIEEGVQAQGVDLGGKTVAEARELLEECFENISVSSLTVTFDGREAVTTPGDLGLTWDVEEAVEEAASLGKSGPLIARYKAQMDLRYENVTVEVPHGYNRTAIRVFVEDEIASCDTEAADASMSLSGGELVITEEVDGLVTDVAATVTAITQALDESLSEDMTVEAVVDVTVPEVTAELLFQIQDVLGTYSTSYSSSSSNRKTNIRVASGRIDGSLLMPGESLSVSDTILSRTAANGYELAPQYVNGDTEESYGGGVCQVSTTLYNAVIRAELQVDERHPHSMVVNYVPYSSDAAIAEGSKDFIFTNDSDYPIYIAASADGATLTFTIYGKETRDEGRTIEFVSDTLSYTTPSDTTMEDSSMDEGETRTEGTVHPAVHSTLTKVVYENGVEVSRETMNDDSYRGSGRTIYKGTKKTVEETTTAAVEETTASSEEETTKNETTTAAETTKKETTTTAEETTKKKKETTTAAETTKKETTTTAEETTKKKKETTAAEETAAAAETAEAENATKDSGE